MSGSITMPRSIVDRPFTYAKWEIDLSQDWEDSFVVREGEKPIDLTGKRLEWTILPRFGHSNSIYVATSANQRDISIDDAARGAVTIFIQQAQLADIFPAGAWHHFFTLIEDSVHIHALKRNVFRGDFIVHAGRGGL
ncbi:hypothetical protein [Tardiphaga sp.]|uniref:hypothetical protein n=1 Tax=Tardiphaga sp. TaxID=1926292 RepID=UPI0026234322|nr:hypothetical protein [Tardiphaga sp.]MDB5620765.1 hypothetical protein [Tardiphaga sp.]